MRTLNEVIDGLPPSQQQEIAAKLAQLMDEEMKRRDLNEKIVSEIHHGLGTSNTITVNVISRLGSSR